MRVWDVGANVGVVTFACVGIGAEVVSVELVVLQGASRLLSEVRPRIAIEVSDGAADAVSGLLHEARYRLFASDEGDKAITRAVFNTLATPVELT